MNYLEFNKNELVNLEYSLRREVLRTNRAGSYSCSTIVDCNTRKYHGLLVCPLPGLDGGRHVLLSSLDETIIQHERDFNLGLHKYAGDNYEPKGHKYIRDFVSNPIPRLVYGVGGVVFSKEKILVYNEPRVLVKYTLEDAHSPTKLRFKPFLAFRNIHALSKANMDAMTRYREIDNGIASRLYYGYPELFIQCSKKCEFVPAPDWYYNIEYMEDQTRGYDFKEDLFVPGYFEVSIAKGESIVVSAGLSEITTKSLKTRFNSELKRRVPRDSFENCLINSASQFFVSEGKQTHILAGYPWLPARSRDALISLPGLLIGHENPSVYKSVIDTMIEQMDGCLMNEHTNQQIYVDCQTDVPLWFIWTIQQLNKMFPDDNIWKLYGKSVKKILTGYLGQKNKFTVKENGLVYSLHNTMPNSWMNAEIDGKPVTPRDGYAVETNALWYNAICFALDNARNNKDYSFIKKWEPLASKAKESFIKLFWDEDRGYLADFINEQEVNIKVRPNQVFAAAFEFSMLDKPMIKTVIETVEKQMLTPYGLRTLAPNDPDYKSFYRGNHNQRELAAFNGSVSPWLISFYIDALMKIQPRTYLNLAKKFISSIEPEMQIRGIGSISELFHGDPPHNGKGALSFAMNTSAMLKLQNLVETQVV
jgi:predicted glycogen debranching enzyme